MNNIAHSPKMQVWQKKVFIPKPEVSQNPEYYFNESCNSAITLLNIFVKLFNREKVVAISIKNLAKMCNLHPRTINRGLKELTKVGIISSYRRANKDEKIPNLYRISYFIYNYTNRKILRKFLPSLCGIVYSLLPIISSKSENVAQNIKELGVNYYYNNTPPIVSHTLRILTTKNRGLSKMSDNSNPISQSIRNLPLKLTKWGQIKLMEFSDDVIDYAAQELSYATPKEPLLWFFSVCQRYSRDNGIMRRTGLVAELSKKYNMPENPKLILEESGGGKKGFDKSKTIKTVSEHIASWAQGIPETKVDPGCSLPKRNRYNPVEEYYRFTALKETPKYKRARVKLERLGLPDYPQNFAAEAAAIVGTDAIDPYVLKSVIINELDAHQDGKEHYCSREIWDSEKQRKECAFFELSQDQEYVKKTRLEWERMRHEKQNPIFESEADDTESVPF